MIQIHVVIETCTLSRRVYRDHV